MPALRPVAILLLFLTTSPAFAFEKPGSDDWPNWRGPNKNGVAAAGQQIPTAWNATRNVVWRTPVPGRGHSSPTIVGDRIFIATADEDAQTQGVVAFDRTTGRQLWQTQVSQGGFPKTHRKNTHATCTIACDGTRLFVTFHHHARLTLAALTLDGAKAWTKDAGPYNPKRYEYGYAPSPALYDSLVIVAGDYEKGGALAAFDRRSGNEVWRTSRPNKLSFSSPVVAHVAGRDQLLISGCDLVASYDPQTGKELWSVKGTTMATCGTIVWNKDTVFASGGYPGAETIAVKADGSGQVRWRDRQRCYEQSMLAHDGHLYAITDRGTAICWRASDGEVLWQQRLAGPVSSSPVLVGETIYQAIENGTTYVFKAEPNRFQLVAKNKLGTEAFATPAFCGNRIYTRVTGTSRGRRQEYLYCLGLK
ncbi:MAG: dehydrogenase [Planctomycetaceae bacterium]|nr:dehydrogenase [Planctomycetaceae bacterium]